MFCSKQCLNLDVPHKASCTSVTSQQHEISRNFLFRSIEILGSLDAMYDVSKSDSKKTVFDFDFSNPNDPMYDKNLLVAVFGLSRIVEVERQKTKIDQNLSEQEKLSRKCSIDYLRIWSTNSFYLNQNLSKSVEYEFASSIGSGIFPFMSLLNHSCYPNVTHITVDNKNVLTVSRPIKAGEQIFITYGYSSFRYTRDERKQKLARYKFNCDCIACIEDYPKLEKLPKDDRRRFKEPEFDVHSTKAAIIQFKTNCKYIGRNIKTHPTYEVMQLILHNDFILHGVTELNSMKLESNICK